MARADPPEDHRVLDVREIEGEPFSQICNCLDDLNEDESLVLINDFEPVPLYDVLDDRGFEYDAECVADDEWRIHVHRPPESGGEPRGELNTFGGTPRGDRPVARSVPAETLDLRDVPPPERHPKIHDAFAALDSGETLELVNDHEPKPLFYEMKAEVDEFDAEGYEVERRGPSEFVAHLPKR